MWREYGGRRHEAGYMRSSTSFVITPYPTSETNRGRMPRINYGSDDASVGRGQSFLKRCGRHRPKVIARGELRPDVSIILEQRGRRTQQRLRERGAGLSCGK